MSHPSCPQCRNLQVAIRLPNDLRRAIRRAAAACQQRHLQHLGEGAYGDPFPELARTESWGDFVNSYFACSACGQLFRLQAETYHGSGGAFGPVSEIAELISKPMALPAASGGA